MHPEKTTFKTFERDFGTSKLSCSALLIKGFNTSEAEPESHCFSSTDAILLYFNTPGGVFQTTVKDFVNIQGHYLARNMQMFLLGKPWLKVQISTVTRIMPEGLQAFAIPAGAVTVTPRVRQWIGVSGGDS